MGSPNFLGRVGEQITFFTIIADYEISLQNVTQLLVGTIHNANSKGANGIETNQLSVFLSDNFGF